MRIRPATTQDAASIAELWNTIIRDTFYTFTSQEKQPANIAQSIRDDICFLVAEDTGKIAGFATYSQFRNGPGYAHSVEHSIVVDEAHAGKHVGRQLMQQLEQHARDTGHHTMIGGISSANPRGQTFHEALGYTHMGTLREVGHKRGQWLDLHLMQKML